MPGMLPCSRSRSCCWQDDGFCDNDYSKDSIITTIIHKEPCCDNNNNATWCAKRGGNNSSKTRTNTSYESISETEPVFPNDSWIVSISCSYDTLYDSLLFDFNKCFWQYTPRCHGYCFGNQSSSWIQQRQQSTSPAFECYYIGSPAQQQQRQQKYGFQ